MELKQLFADNDAVSPVIGVILMVAITVILAAVIGTFVLGLGDQVSDSAPSANIAFSFENGTTVEVSHRGGDALTDSNIDIVVGGTTAYDGAGNTGDPGDISTSPAWDAASNSNDGWGSEITAGDSVIMSEGDVSSNDGETVQVVWSSPSSGDTAIIGNRDWSA